MSEIPIYPGAIVISGASGGIGLALVEELLSKRIFNIACQYRTRKTQLFQTFLKYGLCPEEHCFQADLTQETDLARFRRQVNTRFKTTWAIVNLAGSSSNSMSWNLTKEAFTKVIDNNLTSTFLLSREFIPQLRRQCKGRIINISSIVAFSGVKGASHYSAAKAGIVGLTRSLAVELAQKKITVNVVALGYFGYGLINDVPIEVRNKLELDIPMKRFGRIQDFSSILMNLLSEESEYITGQVFHVNGGLYI